MIEARRVEESYAFRYSVCTIVNDPADYDLMRQSFESAGFVEGCEYLYVDNVGLNRFDAYSGARALLNAAQGEFVVFCHQDVRLVVHGRADLDEAISNLTKHDPRWAIFGNAGCDETGQFYDCILDPNGDRQHGPFPAKVCTLDENFMVLRADARLSTSSDLGGFHFYGPDLCTVADVLGRSAYVVPFKLQHLSKGGARETYLAAGLALQDKYRRAFRDRYIDTVIGFKAMLTGSPAQLAVSRLLRPKGKHVWRHVMAKLSSRV